MVEIKCPTCSVITCLDEKFFLDRTPDRFANTPGLFLCQSCGKNIPRSVYYSVRSLIIKEYFDGWEIGTVFPKE